MKGAKTKGTKVLKIEPSGYGNYLGIKHGSLLIRDRMKKEKVYPLFESEIGEVKIKSGNMVSSGFLATCGYFGIDVLILTQKGNPVRYSKELRR